MKKINWLVIYVLAIVVTFIACKPDIMPEEKSFCAINSTEGNKIDRVEFRLSGQETQTYTRSYNVNGLLDAIKSVKYNFIKDSFRYDNQNRLNVKISYREYRPKGGDSGYLDSLFYDTNNRVNRIKSYAFYNGIMINTETVYFFYNANGEVEKDTTDNRYVYGRLYEWQNGNLVSAKLVSKTGEIFAEQFFKYDDKKNIFPSFISDDKPFLDYILGNPIGAKEMASLNNVVSASSKSYSSPSRNTLYTYEYCYNSQGYPVFIKGSRGDTTLIFYKN
jgi:hypothetical protein